MRQESEATAARDERGSTEERGSAEVRGSIEALARTASVREDDGGAETALAETALMSSWRMLART